MKRKVFILRISGRQLAQHRAGIKGNIATALENDEILRDIAPPHQERYIGVSWILYFH